MKTWFLALFIILALGSFSTSAKAQVAAGERAALIALYQQTAGDQWTKRDNWCKTAQCLVDLQTSTISSMEPGRNMRRPMTVFLGLVLTALVVSGSASGQGAAGEQKSLLIVFSDGHRQNIPVNEIDRIDFKSAPIVVFKDGHRQNLPIADAARIEFPSFSKNSPIGRNHFLGKWRVGVDPVAADVAAKDAPRRMTPATRSPRPGYPDIGPG